MKNLLFPHKFARIGWLMFIPAVLLGLLTHFNPITVTGDFSTVLNDAIIIGTALGAILIVCSKDRIEDEMISAIRLSSILNVTYIFVTLIIVGTLFTNGENYIELLLQFLYLTPLMLVFVFRMEMYRHHKQADNEEQD